MADDSDDSTAFGGVTPSYPPLHVIIHPTLRLGASVGSGPSDGGIDDWQPAWSPDRDALYPNDWRIPWTPANDAFFPNGWQLPSALGTPAAARGLGINNPRPAPISNWPLPAPASRSSFGLPLPPPQAAFDPPIFLKDYLPGHASDPWNNRAPAAPSTPSTWDESQSLLYGITKLRDTPSVDDPQTAPLGIIPAPNSSPYVGPGIIPAPKGYRPPDSSALPPDHSFDPWSTFAPYVPPVGPVQWPPVPSETTSTSNDGVSVQPGTVDAPARDVPAAAAMPRVMPGIGQAFAEGIASGTAGVGQTFQAISGKRPIPTANAGALAESFGWSDLQHPLVRLAPKVAYRTAQSYPSTAGGFIGMGVGAGLGGVAAGPPGAAAGVLVGGPIGAALGEAAQILGPAFAEQLQRTPNDPDGAWNRAVEHAVASGAFAGAAWAAAPLRVLQGPLKNLLFQAFGVQGGLAAAEQVTQNAIDGRPLTEGVGDAYAGGTMGGLVPAAATHGTIWSLSKLPAGSRRFRSNGGEPGESFSSGSGEAAPGSDETGRSGSADSNSESQTPDEASRSDPAEPNSQPESGSAVQPEFRIAPYGELKGTLPKGYQAHHLNEVAAYGASIPRDKGVAIAMRGDAFTQPGTPHYIYHQYMKAFWNQYLTKDETSPFFNKKPTNAEFGQASYRALIEAGIPPDQAARAVAAAAEQRAKYKELAETANVPRIPGSPRKEQ